jgi:AmmeMemoRadiSam system protein A
MIPEPERAALLDVARGSITRSLGLASSPSRPEAAVSHDYRAGAFVTLHTRGELRGCIGHIEADRPLPDVVASCAVSAAASDPRFAPLTPPELQQLEIEISVLGPLEVVRTLGDVEVGRHGLLIEHRRRRGLLLPQVAPEWGWDAATFVAQTCRKAGLPPDAWPAGGATLYRFEAEVFSENNHHDRH